MTKDKFYVPAIDGLRALAVVSVIINHFNENLLPSGFLGVDIFFVISGYVITASLINRGKQNTGEFFKGFYKRRIKRLLPALLFCFVLGGIFISFFNSDPRNHLITGLFSLIGFSNIELFLNSVDYWGEDAKFNPFTHTWSLGVEEQFYLVFPLLLWLTTTGIWKSSSLNKMRWILLFLCGISFYYFVALSDQHRTATYFLMPFRFWEIGLGCTLFIYIKNKADFNHSLINNIPLSVILASLLLTLFIPQKYSVIATGLIVFLTLFVLFKLILIQKYTEHSNNVLSWKLTLYVGKISYSLYLWHWVFIVIGKWTWGITVWTSPVLILLMMLFSMFSYHLIEKPMRHTSWSSSLKSQLFLLVALSFIVFISFNLITKNDKNYFYLGETDENGQVKTHINNNPLPCNTNENTGVKQTMRTVGNSHAGHIIPMLRVISSECNIDLVYEKNQKYIVIPSGDNLHKNQIKTVISELKRDDILILSSRNRFLYSIPYLKSTGDYWFDHSELKENKGFGLTNWLTELDEILQLTKIRGVNVILFLPTVEFDTKVLNYKQMCGKDWFKAERSGCNPKVSKEFLNSRFPSEFFAEVRKRESSFDNFYIFDPQPILCPDDQDYCERIIDGVVAYIDTNHLSPNGAKLLLEPFTDFLIENKIID